MKDRTEWRLVVRRGHAPRRNDTYSMGEDAKGESDDGGGLSDQFAILITCTSETQQTKLLGRFQREGLPCKAYVL